MIPKPMPSPTLERPTAHLEDHETVARKINALEEAVLTLIVVVVLQMAGLVLVVLR